MLEIVSKSGGHREEGGEAQFKPARAGPNGLRHPEGARGAWKLPFSGRFLLSPSHTEHPTGLGHHLAAPARSPWHWAASSGHSIGLGHGSSPGVVPQNSSERGTRAPQGQGSPGRTPSAAARRRRAQPRPFSSLHDVNPFCQAPQILSFPSAMPPDSFFFLHLARADP